MTISSTHAKIYIFSLTIIGLLHHTDHILRYDHSGWPFRPEISPFTFTLFIYPLIVSWFLLKNKKYRIITSLVIGILLIGAHTFLETPSDQYYTWALNSSLFPGAFGHPNILNIKSVLLGYVSVKVSMVLNVGTLFLPLVFWKEKNE